MAISFFIFFAYFKKIILFQHLNEYSDGLNDYPAKKTAAGQYRVVGFSYFC